MRFGLQKLTLLDYAGLIACTVFCSGCNFRCPFCHNSLLVNSDKNSLDYSMEDIIEFLEKRCKQLDGICISGGEPLLHDETFELAEAAKSLGYKVKLDTNGSFPEKLKQIVESKLIDYVAADIKNSPGKYFETCGSQQFEKVEQSVKFLFEGKVDYEFRTTVTGNLHEVSDFIEIGRFITGAKRYYLQKFINSGSILSNNPQDFEISDIKLAECLQTVRKFIPHAEIRGY